MNKTVNINLGNILFHIDEDAYNKLKRYLEAVERSLSDDPEGKKEIIADIEIRIGELLSEKITDERQVVNMLDIESVIGVMGQPEDYVIDEEYHNKTYTTSNEKNKKLFRDSNDKFLGGVSSGIAHYFGISPLIIRLLFIVLTFGFGMSIIVYILLWILLPQATSTSEKLQMRGEAVNIDNIEKRIKEELIVAKEKINNADFGKTKSGFQDILDTLGSFIGSIFKIFGKFIGGILIFAGIIALISLIAGAFSIGSIEILGFGNELANYPDFFYDSYIPVWLLTIFLFIAIAVPFIALLILGIKILTNNTKSFGKTVNLTLLGIWLISILGLSFAGIEQATRTANNGFKISENELAVTKSDTLTIKMQGNDLFSDTKYLRRSYAEKVVLDQDQNKLYSSRVSVDVRQSDDNLASIKIKKHTKGRTVQLASEAAKLIEYDYDLSNGYLLLNSYFLSDLKNKHKNQKVSIIVYIPIGTTLFLDANTKHFLYDVENIQDVHDNNMGNQFYKMTKKGLNCLDCNDDIIRNDDIKNLKINLGKKGLDIKVNGEKKSTIKIDSNGVEIN